MNMTTRIASYSNFEQATQDLKARGFESVGQDGMLGNLYRNVGDLYRLVKNDWTGKHDLTALNY